MYKESELVAMSREDRGKAYTEARESQGLKASEVRDQLGLATSQVHQWERYGTWVTNDALRRSYFVIIGIAVDC
jgi:uncharacterized protein YjcR